ncbi:phage tail tube protein, partial [Leclercia adecarboxylata]
LYDKDIIMPTPMDVFTGSNITVCIGTAGPTTATTFTTIPEIAAFPGTGSSANVIEVVSFNSAYNRKLVGSKTNADVTLQVNWMPDNTVHQQLVTAFENGTRIQLKFSYFTDATKTAGSYVVYNGFISEKKIESDRDKVVNMTLNFACDGAAVAQGLLP